MYSPIFWSSYPLAMALYITIISIQPTGFWQRCPRQIWELFNFYFLPSKRLQVVLVVPLRESRRECSCSITSDGIAHLLDIRATFELKIWFVIHMYIIFRTSNQSLARMIEQCLRGGILRSLRCLIIIFFVTGLSVSIWVMIIWTISFMPLTTLICTGENTLSFPYCWRKTWTSLDRSGAKLFIGLFLNLFTLYSTTAVKESIKT